MVHLDFSFKDFDSRKNTVSKEVRYAFLPDHIIVSESGGNGSGENV